MVSLPTGPQSMFLLDERFFMAARPSPSYTTSARLGLTGKGQLHPPETQ
jgi:hypothetical protein